MKISVFEVEDWERERLSSLQGQHNVRFVREPLDAELADEHADAEVVSVFIYSDLDPEAISRLGRLEMVATRSTGFDHIDLDACRERGIVVANVPTYGENTVAEHVFALLLAISHRVLEAADRTRRGDFSLQGLDGFDLRGRALGVIGTGYIGRHTIRIARGFGMDVIAYDTEPDEELAADLDFTYTSLAELLSSADVVSVHVPGSKRTHHLLSDAEFEAMKDGAVLINTSRGSVVDSRALLRALGSGKLAAAGLDVLEEEPAVREEAELLRRVFAREHDLETLLTDHILLRLRNVVITPHSAFYTREAVGRILEVTAENIEAFAAGNPINQVGGTG